MDIVSEQLLDVIGSTVSVLYICSRTEETVHFVTFIAHFMGVAKKGNLPKLIQRDIKFDVIYCSCWH